ncbi:uncharacterized protein [Ptychodera flava]|uniref:uncharacterized protein n=1 Tax=Ptychodera flava TaxID=63121 RepID=UPI00396A11B6
MGYKKMNSGKDRRRQRSSRFKLKMPRRFRSSNAVQDMDDLSDSYSDDEQHNDKQNNRRFVLTNVAVDTPSDIIEYYLEGRASTCKTPSLDKMYVIVEFAEDIDDFERLKARIEEKPLNEANVSIRRLSDTDEEFWDQQ